MKFDKRILDYQAIDQELIALENEVAKSKERQNLVATKVKLDEATEKINKIATDANEILAQYASYNEKLNALQSKLAEFDGIVDGIEDVSEAEYYIKQIDNILAEIATLEKSAGKDSSRAETVFQDFANTWNVGTQASKAYNQASKEYNEMMKELQPKVQEIQKKLSDLKKDIPEELVKVYTTLRNAKMVPAFVEYDKENARCGRCRMDVPNDTKEKLRTSDNCAECPNCRRILYTL